MRTRLYLQAFLSALTGGVALVPALASAQTLLNTLALVSQFLNSLIYLFYNPRDSGLFLGSHPLSLGCRRKEI